MSLQYIKTLDRIEKSISFLGPNRSKGFSRTDTGMVTHGDGNPLDTVLLRLPSD